MDRAMILHQPVHITVAAPVLVVVTVLEAVGKYYMILLIPLHQFLCCSYFEFVFILSTPY